MTSSVFPEARRAQLPGVLIVGAGPVGLTAACELRRRGVACRIVDRAPEAARTSRATDIHARSLELFARMGVIDPMLAAGKPVRGFRAHSNGKPISSLDYEGLESAYPFTLALPQVSTESILAARLGELGGTIERGVELVELAERDGRARVALRRADGSIERAAYRWVLACDGVRSSVRRLLDVPFEGVTYAQTYLVGDFEIDWEHSTDVVHLFMSREGFCNVLALPGASRVRVLCDVEPGAAEPTLETFEALIAGRAKRPARLSAPASLASFRIQRRLVADYRRGPVLLAGDAAHVCSPLMGQGMNTGVQDAFDLAWKLALVETGRAPADLLDTYEADRRPVARAVLRDTHLLHTAATTRGGVAGRIRDLAMAASSRWSLGRRLAGQRCSELGTGYGRPLARLAAAVAGRIDAGARLPDLETGAGAWRLHDLCDETRHTLLLFDGERGDGDFARLARLGRIAATRFADVVAVERIRPGVEPVERLVPRSGRAGWRLPWTDVGAVIHRRLGATRPTALLIRPDGHVAARLRLDPGALLAILSDTFGRDVRAPTITKTPAIAGAALANTGS